MQERHLPSDWKTIVQQTVSMMQLLSKSPLTEKDFQKIEIPVRLSVGDRDAMVTVNETIETYRSLKQGSLLVLPDKLHPFEKVDSIRLANEIKLFFNHVS